VKEGCSHALYQCAAPVGLVTRDMKARIALISGEIVVSFAAGEVNLVMQPGQSGHAAVTVLLDGKPIVDARGTDVGADGVARFDRSGIIRLVAGVPRRRARADTRLERPGATRICVHLRSLRKNRARMLPTPG
jgi:hypothetical protein